jgi:methylphosphotriester-DNA--protein-cysteine methyltransferase
MAENVLYYGDNLEILRRYIEDESVDLVHLDPPFKSDQDFNILFAERNGGQTAAQREVFHRPDCEWAKKINPQNLVGFKTREDAIKSGKRPCKVCKP